VSEIEYRTDLYQGAASFYDRFRPPYPQELLDDLCERVPVSGSGRLVDLACGTGQITFALAGQFAEVWAVDQEAEFVAFGQDKAISLGVTNTRWLTGSAETADLDGPFELATVGNAFHRLNRPAVAERMLTWLQPGGAAALVWGNGPHQNGDAPWQRAMAKLLHEWMQKAGAADRVPAGWQEAAAPESNEQVLRRAGFDYVGRFEFTDARRWTVETLTGYALSTSYLNPQVLGTSLSEFERDMSDRLSPFAPEGTFEELTSSAYDLARKPRSSRS
jgi:ubiquinone/menaquinone biosynthesis C-methylase UbiE